MKKINNKNILRFQANLQFICSIGTSQVKRKTESMAPKSMIPRLAHSPTPTWSPHAYKNQPSVMKRGRQQHFPPLSRFLTLIAGLIAPDLSHPSTSCHPIHMQADNLVFRTLSFFGRCLAAMIGQLSFDH